MSLAPGTRIGPYEVISIVGEGGMGQVFRARDTKLKREVALKVLPDSVANDSDRLARFTREAQTLASLNHPNIAQIHGLEESGERGALVMELVEGPTLADRIARGPMPLDEVIAIATQIAEALEAAHERGIIHRDLKPANVKVRPDGTVKVLDFGLAKAMDSAPTSDASASQSPNALSPRNSGRDRPWHHRLHVARAGAWQICRPSRRHLGMGISPVRDGPAGAPSAAKTPRRRSPQC